MIYYLFVYRGLSGFVRMFLNDIGFKGIDLNCFNLYGIIFLYLVKFKIGIVDIFKGKRDYWQEIIDLIESYGGVFFYFNCEVEFYVIY